MKAIQFSPQFLDAIRGAENRVKGVASNAISALRSDPFALSGNRVIQKYGQKALDMGVGAVQDVARQAASVPLTTRTATGKSVPDFTPTSRLEKNIFGTEPVQPAQRNKTSEFLQSHGISGNTADLVSPLILAGSIASNVLPGGAEKKEGVTLAENAVKAITNNDIKPPPLPNNPAFQAARTALQQTVKPRGILKTLADPFTQSLKVLADLSPTGKRLATTVRDTFANAEVQAGKAIDTVLTPFNKLTKAEKANFVEVAKGHAQPISDRVSQVAQAYDTVRQDIATQASNLGLFKHGPRENYFTQSIKPEYLANAKNEKKIVQHLLDTNQASTPEEAQGILNSLKENVGGQGTQQHLNAPGQMNRSLNPNLELSRTDIQLPKEAYNNDAKEVLTKYFTNAYKDLNVAQNFGLENGDRYLEKANTMLDQIASEGGDVKKARDILDSVIHPQSAGPVSSFVTKVEGAVRLPFSFISNATQPTNTITTKGLGNTLQALGRYLTNPGEAISLAKKSGSLNNDLLKEATASYHKSWTDKLPWMKAFGKVEDFNRILDANASDFALRAWVGRVLKNPNDKTAVRNLSKQFGVDAEQVIKDGGLKGDNYLKALNESVNQSQFRTRAQDLPTTFSRLPRVFTQFKTFAFKQAQFVMDHAVKEAVAGNPTPLIRYLVAGTALGEAASFAKSSIKNSILTAEGKPTKDRSTGTKRVLEDQLQAGGFGALSDVGSSIANGTQSVLQWIVGPVTSDLASGAANTYNATQGKPQALERQLLRTIPYAGSGLASDIVTPRSGGSKKSAKDLPLSGSSGSGQLNIKKFKF